MENINEVGNQILNVLRPLGAQKVALFGSIVRGDESPDSDIDILVKFREPVGLFALARLKRNLGEKLGREVDLITEGALSKYIRPFVEREEFVLYEE